MHYAVNISLCLLADDLLAVMVNIRILVLLLVI